MLSPISGITEVVYAGDVIKSARLRREDIHGEFEVVDLTRDMLLKTVKEKGTVVTLSQRTDGRWEKLDPVNIVKMGTAEFLKCINDGYACDDLGDVPSTI